LPSMMHNPNDPEDVLKVDTDDQGRGGDDYYDAARYGVMVNNSLGITI
jgi:phage terminase large subunit